MIVGLPAGGAGAPGSYILHERAAQFYGASFHTYITTKEHAHA